MIDIEGKELEVGVVYILSGSNTHIVVGRFSHETEYCYIFKPVHITNNYDIRGSIVYTWRRQIPKRLHEKSIAVVRASQELIDRYDIK